MSCVSSWDYEQKPNQGYIYNESDLLYNSTEFDTYDVYYNSLGLATVWSEEISIVDVIADWDYEKRVGQGYIYNEVGLEYNSSEFDTYNVFYNSFGQATEWFYEDFIDYCTPVVFQFMDGEDYQFQNGDLFEFN